MSWGDGAGANTIISWDQCAGNSTSTNTERWRYSAQGTAQNTNAQCTFLTKSFLFQAILFLSTASPGDRIRSPDDDISTTKPDCERIVLKFSYLVQLRCPCRWIKVTAQWPFHYTVQSMTLGLELNYITPAVSGELVFIPRHCLNAQCTECVISGSWSNDFRDISITGRRRKTICKDPICDDAHRIPEWVSLDGTVGTPTAQKGTNGIP